MELTDPILKTKYPAKSHAAAVASYLQKSNPEFAEGTIYLQGQETHLLEDNDAPQPFRQRRAFFYLSGCALPDCHLIYKITTAQLTLFIPPIDPDSVIWSGLPLSPENALDRYDVDTVLPSTSLTDHLSSLLLLRPNSHLFFVIPAHLSDSTPLKEQILTNPNTNLDSLHSAIDVCRVVKDAYEIASVRHANAVTTAAHIAVLKALKTASNECELEAVFLERCLALGCKHQAYTGIFGAGTSAATLHYVHNDQPLRGKRNLLVDAAAEWGCYCADVTRTMPLTNGRFDRESKAVYELVRRMQEESLALVRAGVRWEDVHLRAHAVAIDGLLRLGILRGEETEIAAAGTSVAFFPHGLGHYLGLDTHDTGGNPDYHDSNRLMRYLRVRGPLPAGSIVTVEPGIYFCRFIIEPYLKDEKHNRYINETVLEKFWDVGGVRIEDDILVTAKGYENLTTAPKEIAEIEQIISGQ